jgi:cytochrome c553
MHPTRFLAVLALAGLVLQPGRASQAGDKKIDFAHDVAPLLKARCAECHTNGKYKGSLSLDTREDLLKAKVAKPGKSGESELIARVTSKDPGQRMPPKGPALSEKEVALLRAWIDQGLAWESGFSFKISTYAAPLRPRRPTLPPAALGAKRPQTPGHNGRDHPIDRILDAYYAQHKLTPPAPAEDAIFLRRAYLDLIGQLPTPTELQRFLDDSTADKRGAVVRRLLRERRAFADHWLGFWNDLLRNDYKGTGYIDGGRKQISAWLYQSLLDNKPYDQFTRELINPVPGAEGFIFGIKWRGRVNASQVPEVQFAQNVSQVFFGVNVKCASCHDSFIDSWKLEDAYSLAAVLADRPLEIHRCDKPTGKTAAPRFLWPELGDIDPKAPRGKRLEQLAGLITHPENGRFTRTIVNRLWQRLMGRGIVHPVDAMASRPWSEDLLDYLAVYLADQKSDLRKLLEHIATSRAYQARHAVVEKQPAGQDYVFRGPGVQRLTAEQFVDAVWQITRAGPKKPAAPVKLPPEDPAVPADRRYVRASLVNADLLMRSLGRPNREQVVTTRPDLLTTLEALDLANGQILTDTLRQGAALILQRNLKAAPAELVESLYLQALSRRPTSGELATAQEVLGSPPTIDGLADLLWAVFMLPEFQLIR